MKILKNKVGNYDIPSINSRWVCKGRTSNSHFSRDKPFKVMKLESCESREGSRCIYASISSSYYEELRDLLKGEDCADVLVVYKYEHNGLVCKQCYHSFMEGAEHNQ